MSNCKSFAYLISKFECYFSEENIQKAYKHHHSKMFTVASLERSHVPLRETAAFSSAEWSGAMRLVFSLWLTCAQRTSRARAREQAKNILLRHSCEHIPPRDSTRARASLLVSDRYFVIDFLPIERTHIYTSRQVNSQGG